MFLLSESRRVRDMLSHMLSHTHCDTKIQEIIDLDKKSLENVSPIKNILLISHSKYKIHK